MAGKIFISYQRSDQARAEQLDRLLRERGVTPWFDARLRAGDEWRAAIADALEASRIFVLLYSAKAAASTEIAKELAVATMAKQQIVPVRLEDIRPKGAFLYELAGRNWFDVFADPDRQMTELADGLAAMARGEEGWLARPASQAAHWPRRRTLRGLVGAAAGVAVAIAIAAGLWMTGHSGRPAVPVGGAGGPGADEVSIAVLPFLNLSPDKDQEFFSDGMTEELTSALAKVPGLRVIGRASAFQFKGENRDLRAIGRALGATNLIEGSVRKQGDALRVTVELVRTGDGTQLWTESYDRKLKNVFAVQEDIAVAIASALKTPLSLKDGQRLVSNRTTDVQSYQEYLKALALERARKPEEMRAVLQTLLARDPGYAPGWALLAQGYTAPVVLAGFQVALAAGRTDEAKRLLNAQQALVETSARKALQLDPNNAVAYNALGALEGHRGHWAAAAQYERRALALDPSSPEALYNYSYLLSATGQLNEAIRVQNQLLAQEPFVPVYRARMADVLWATGQNDAAVKILESLGPSAGLRPAKVYATQGRYADAARAIETAEPAPEYSRAALDEAAKLMRSAPAKVADPAALPRLPGPLDFVYLFIGADGRMLDVVERQMAVGYYGGIFRDPWAPPSAALRKTERFKNFVRKAGFDAYWRQAGWPPFCRPVGANDFACH